MREDYVDKSTFQDQTEARLKKLEEEIGIATGSSEDLPMIQPEGGGLPYSSSSLRQYVEVLTTSLKTAITKLHSHYIDQARDVKA